VVRGLLFLTVGVNEKVIKKYIEHQRLEDSGEAELEF
jgi:hypothetical protein